MPKSKLAKTPKPSECPPDEHPLDIDMSFDGTIARSIGRMLQALSKLVEALVDWVARKLRGNTKNQLGRILWFFVENHSGADSKPGNG